MRRLALITCALALSSSAALAAEMRGCVTEITLSDGRKCILLQTRDGNHHDLVGRNLPPGGGDAVILVRGKRAFGTCPSRLVVSGFQVRSWGPTRVPCPTQQ